MKSMTKILMAVVALAFVAVSCGKYEEGPKISLASKTGRLVNTWKMDAMFINGTEQTLTDDDKDDYIEYKKDGGLTITWVSGTSTMSFEGTWEFSDDKTQIISSYTFGSTTSKDTTDILRLKSGELWLEQVDGAETTEVHYVTK